ncbi:MAG: choice-of-anchor D domain-containing protein, partial [Dolichospermum sp.]
MTNTSAVTQDFNGTVSGAPVSLPANWKRTAAGATSPTWTAGTNVTTMAIAANSGTPATGGSYNWGNSITTTDRAVGFMTSGGYASPNSLMVHFVNNIGSQINDLQLAFDYERYRVNSSACAITFFTSTDGTTWTARTAGDSGAFSTGTNAYTFNGGTVVNRSFTLSGVNIPNGGNLYLRWNFNTTGGNSQGVGLDNFSMTPVVNSGPEINVQGNSTNIVSGDTTPSTTDHTDFGSVNAASGSVVRTFTIQNTGSVALNISDAYLLDGTSGFSITSAPASSVAPSGSTTIQVTFDPSTAGTFNDELVIESDDSDEATYTFAITGVGFVATPEINVQGNSVSIVDGDTTPSTADHTDFGSVTTSSGSVVRTFTIQNTGSAALNISNAYLLDGASGFSITSAPAS